MAQKETILGNYTNFPRFPLDCESMEYIQENIKHLAIVAQIAGCDKLIIKGCTSNSQSRTEGYVYVRTGDDLVGEILYYPGGSGVRCGISTENINATANNETFTSAYTIRKLVSGTTGEWSWSDFRALSEITNSALKTLVDGKAAEGHNHDAVYSKLGHNHDTAYAPKSHKHSISEIINLQGTLDGKAAAGHNHDTVYALKNHNHDDRYYTEAEVRQLISDSVPKYEYITDSRYGVIVYKIGRVATMVISNMDITPNSTQDYVIGIAGLDRWQPTATIYGIGINTSNDNSINNMLYFQLSGTKIRVYNRTGVTKLWGSVTYITKE